LKTINQTVTGKPGALSVVEIRPLTDFFERTRDAAPVGSVGPVRSITSEYWVVTSANDAAGSSTSAADNALNIILFIFLSFLFLRM
jgi:hypothetical protein